MYYSGYAECYKKRPFSQQSFDNRTGPEKNLKVSSESLFAKGL